MNASTPGFDWAERQEDALLLRVDCGLYSEEAIFRTCYVFTDRCYLFLQRELPNHIVVRLRRKHSSTDLERMCGDFANELLNQRIRIDRRGKPTRFAERLSRKPSRTRSPNASDPCATRSDDIRP